MKKIRSLFRKKTKKVYLIILLLSAINSVLTSTLLIFINNTIIQKPLPFFEGYNWLVFVAILVFSFGCTRLFQVFMINLSNDVLLEFELSLLKKLRFASYEVFEALGTERVYTSFGDIRVLAQIPQAFIGFINAAVLTVCGLVYMQWLSWIAGSLILLLMVALFIFYWIRNRQIEKDLNKLRDLQNEYHGYIKDFLNGFKELKMSIKRNDNIYNNFLSKNLILTKNLNTETSIKYQGNELIGAYSWNILLGVILFALPILAGIDMVKISSFVVVVLFLSGPINTLIGVIPFYTRIKIAAERLHSLDVEIEANLKNGENHGDLTKIASAFNSIVFKGVSYTYKDKDKDTGFNVGPINFEISKGEIIFISGGNGSGKSTFINLLTGIYRATTGIITLNGKKISNDNYPNYSNHLSSIFTNVHLFAQNYDEYDLVNPNADLDQYLKLMKLNEIVRINKDKNCLDIKLSKGQQKRLALILALMENKEVLILDEWAAEQDPEFRAYFYKVLLPYFKDLGKTVVAVTHDDAYFECADRLIKFDFGKIVSDERSSILIEEKLLNIV